MSIFTSQRFDVHHLSLNGTGNNFPSPQTRSGVSTSMHVKMPSSKSPKEEFSEDLQVPLNVPKHPTPTDLRMINQPQSSGQESLDGTHRLEFGGFVIREALLDEEYWTAAWLRAESHWEDKPQERYIGSYKRKFADQEFNALKRQCRKQYVQKYTCMVAVKKDEMNEVKNTILNGVVGTLDLSIQQLLHGETFPREERLKASVFSSINKMSPQRYGYVANLCVAKFARRHGIAQNMMHFAIESARSSGALQLFVHVHRENKPAQELYRKIGFQVELLSHFFKMLEFWYGPLMQLLSFLFRLLKWQPLVSQPRKITCCV